MELEYETLLVDEPSPLATPWKRLGAYVLDIVLAVLAAMPGLFLMVGSDEDSPVFVFGVLLMLGGFIAFALYQIVLLSTEGQSVAKRFMKLRIVDVNDESNPGFVRVILLRYFVIGLISGIPFLGFLFSLANYIFIFNSDHRCIHDHLATTKVVDESEIYDELL